MKIFSTFSRTKEAWRYRNEPEEMRALGVFLWRTLLLFALLVVLLALWTGYQELTAALQAENSVSTPNAAPPALNKSQLQSALSYFSAKQSQYQSLSQSPEVQVADPSK